MTNLRALDLNDERFETKIIIVMLEKIKYYIMFSKNSELNMH
jgi:hypothetical protein